MPELTWTTALAWFGVLAGAASIAALVFGWIGQRQTTRLQVDIHAATQTTLADMAKALEIDPKNAGFYANRASVHRQNKDDVRALADYAEAIRLEPDTARQYAVRASIYFQKKEYDKAIAKLAEVLKQRPTLLAVQAEAARTVQHMASLGKPDSYQVAIVGSGKADTAGIWGWGKLAKETSRDIGRFRDNFHEARLNIAVCHKLYAETRTEPDAKRESLERAKRAILETATALDRCDLFEVVAFDSRSARVSPMGPVHDRTTLSSRRALAPCDRRVRRRRHHDIRCEKSGYPEVSRTLRVAKAVPPVRPSRCRQVSIKFRPSPMV